MGNVSRISSLGTRRLRLCPLGRAAGGSSDLRFAIVLGRARRRAGVIMLTAVDWSSRTAEMGTWVAPRYRGRGIGLTAKALLLDHAFGEMGLEGIRFFTPERNIRARQSLARLGANDEGSLTLLPEAAGRHRLYSLWRDEY